MKQSLILKIAVCSSFLAVSLYAYLQQQNEITALRIDLPKLQKQVVMKEEENARLLFEIESFENPSHLMELAKRPEFSHLKYPMMQDVFVVHIEPKMHEEKTYPLHGYSRGPVFIGALPIKDNR